MGAQPAVGAGEAPGARRRWRRTRQSPAVGADARSWTTRRRAVARDSEVEKDGAAGRSRAAAASPPAWQARDGRGPVPDARQDEAPRRRRRARTDAAVQLRRVLRAPPASSARGSGQRILNGRGALVRRDGRRQEREGDADDLLMRRARACACPAGTRPPSARGWSRRAAKPLAPSTKRMSTGGACSSGGSRRGAHVVDARSAVLRREEVGPENASWLGRGAGRRRRRSPGAVVRSRRVDRCRRTSCWRRRFSVRSR